MKSNFLLGQLMLTEPARLILKRQPFDLIARHAINEHGLISKDEAELNEIGMKTRGQIISRYKVDPTDPKSRTVIVLTSNLWDKTTVALEPK